MNAERGTCRVCKENRPLRIDGSVRVHLHPVDREDNGIFRQRCDGSGAAPLERQPR